MNVKCAKVSIDHTKYKTGETRNLPNCEFYIGAFGWESINTMTTETKALTYLEISSKGVNFGKLCCRVFRASSLTPKLDNNKLH